MVYWAFTFVYSQVRTSNFRLGFVMKPSFDWLLIFCFLLETVLYVSKSIHYISSLILIGAMVTTL
jgi:hypothetical protein